MVYVKMVNEAVFKIQVFLSGLDTYPGADPVFFLGGGALVSFSINTNKPHSFFFAEYQLY